AAPGACHALRTAAAPEAFALATRSTMSLVSGKSQPNVVCGPSSTKPMVRFAFAAGGGSLDLIPGAQEGIVAPERHIMSRLHWGSQCADRPMRYMQPASYWHSLRTRKRSNHSFPIVRSIDQRGNRIRRLSLKP